MHVYVDCTLLLQQADHSDDPLHREGNLRYRTQKGVGHQPFWGTGYVCQKLWGFFKDVFPSLLKWSYLLSVSSFVRSKGAETDCSKSLKNWAQRVVMFGSAWHAFLYDFDTGFSENCWLPKILCLIVSLVIIGVHPNFDTLMLVPPLWIEVPRT